MLLRFHSAHLSWKTLYNKEFITFPSMGFSLLQFEKGNSLYFPPKELHSKLTSQVVGGYVHLQMRHASKIYGSKIKNMKKNPSEWLDVKQVEGYDQNSMYVKGLLGEFPVGAPHVRKLKDGYLKSEKIHHSTELSVLLKAISITGNVVIQSGTSPGGSH
jgi:hypothetical protein